MRYERHRTGLGLALALVMAAAGGPATAANTADLDFTLTFGYLGADSAGFPGGGDETFNVEFELPEGGQIFEFDTGTSRNGTTSAAVNQTVGGIPIDDFDSYDALAQLLDPTYDPDDPFAGPPPVYGTSAPPIVIDGTMNATALGPAPGPALNTTYLGTDVTYMYGYYYGDEQEVDLRFSFDLLWSMAFATNEPGFESASINVVMRLLNDNEDVLDEVILTQCAICGGTEPSIGHSQVGFTSNVDQDTPGVGGPVNNGVLTLAHPNLLDDGYFSVEITTDYSVSAIIDPVPVPGVVWLFGSAVLGLAGLRRR